MKSLWLKVLGVCVIAAGSTAIPTSSAQAALSWLVLNATGTTATELKAEVEAEKDTKRITLTTHIIGIHPSTSCLDVELSGVFLFVSGLIKGKIRYKNCEAYGKGEEEEALGCSVHSVGQPAGTIETNLLKGELVLHEVKVGEKEVLAKLEPESGTTLATILTEECILPEANTVNGVVYLKDCEKKPTVHTVKHLLILGPLTKLWVGSDTAEHLETTVSGSAWAKLGGAHKGLSWAAMDA